MWKVVGASAVGTSHESSSTPCQDAFALGSRSFGGEHIVFAAIADGAGSASCSRHGARLAARTAARLLGNIARFGILPRPEQMLDALNAALLAVERAALKRGLPVHEFASTLLVAAVSSRSAVFGQVGDGCWVVRRNGELVAATWPTTGFYANETTFLTSSEWRRAAQIECLDGSIDALVGFTDGLQSLALNIAARAAHGAFLEPLLEAVAEPMEPATLAPALEQYLSSAAINMRTDDDKTLVLAILTGVPLLQWRSSTVADEA